MMVSIPGRVYACLTLAVDDVGHAVITAETEEQAAAIGNEWLKHYDARRITLPAGAAIQLCSPEHHAPGCAWAPLIADIEASRREDEGL